MNDLFYQNYGSCAWSLLHNKASDIVTKLERTWKKLLRENTKEEVYHRFLSEHAGFFLARMFDDEIIVISKLRLGANFVVDFVKTKDCLSAGIQYEFIEIETPGAPPYTKKGNPSARLMAAVQQIDNWKMWIKENRYEFQKIFPFYNRGITPSERLKFTVVIGTRENSQQWLERRNHFSDEHSIRIRSFESFTENLKRRGFPDFVRPHLLENCSWMQAEELANPFCKAYSDKAWRSLIDSYRHCYRNADLTKFLLDSREYNELFHKFKKKWLDTKKGDVSPIEPAKHF
jgi:hypothetical protein